MRKFKVQFRISVDGKKVTKEVEQGVANVNLKMLGGSPENGFLFTVEGTVPPIKRQKPN